MRFLYSFIGAVLGALLGGAAALLVAVVEEEGHLSEALLKVAGYGLASLVVDGIAGGIAGLWIWRSAKSRPHDKQAKRTIAHKFAGFALAICVATGAVLWLADCYTLAPSDQQLISNFKQHRAIFNELTQMPKSDKGFVVVNINDKMIGDCPSSTISPARSESYRRLLNTAKVYDWFVAGSDKTQTESAKFCCWQQGFAHTENTSKGYCYSSLPPDKNLLSNSLDYPNLFAEDDDGTAFRHIEGYWYLYCDHSPGE
jgi:hypothetical protein